MSKYTNIIRNITCLICLFSLVYGCTDKKSKPEPPKKIVSKKISVQPQDKIAPVPKAVVTQPPSAPEKPVLADAGSTAPQKGDEKADTVEGKEVIPDKASPSLAKESVQAKVAIGYDPKGRIDPFIPLVKDEPQKSAVAATKKVERKKRVPTTPLERIDLSQLRLRAVVRSASGNKALVEEASGKGYIITKGTFIGVNQGTVIEIQKDKIVVEEEIEDIQGEITVKKRELRLPKPPGEE